ncbi:unnamed protein product [Chrysodeixis includens]|uniref:Uncharacterized protein n=1 Tax=Chrysodeixis includens TaxID=689277 RepID=A0A9P0BG65_CHRIL|nr:unnamed protein product [Chrysodeixis includens]
MCLVTETETLRGSPADSRLVTRTVRAGNQSASFGLWWHSIAYTTLSGLGCINIQSGHVSTNVFSISDVIRTGRSSRLGEENPSVGKRRPRRRLPAFRRGSRRRPAQAINSFKTSRVRTRTMTAPDTQALPTEVRTDEPTQDTARVASRQPPRYQDCESWQSDVAAVRDVTGPGHSCRPGEENPSERVGRGGDCRRSGEAAGVAKRRRSTASRPQECGPGLWQFLIPRCVRGL